MFVALHRGFIEHMPYIISSSSSMMAGEIQEGVDLLHPTSLES